MSGTDLNEFRALLNKDHIAGNFSIYKVRHDLAQALMRREIGTQVTAFRGRRSTRSFSAATMLDKATITKLESATGVPPSLNTLFEVGRRMDLPLLCRYVSWPDFVALHPFGTGRVSLPPRFDAEEFRRFIETGDRSTSRVRAILEEE